ncbi:MAG: 3D domain-containing protein [candidate division WOR-3 bacterium]|nr:3D domain-containing protein [candidate division WOR-3 bacterium]
MIYKIRFNTSTVTETKTGFHLIKRPPFHHLGFLRKSRGFGNRLLRILPVLLIFELFCLNRAIVQNNEKFVQPSEIQKVTDKEPASIHPLLESLKVTGYQAGELKYLGKFRVTFYWIVKESDYSGPKTTPLYLENGQLLGYFPYKFVKDFKKESCAELKDGRRISYLKKINKVRIVDRFLGHSGYHITPMTSVAVDPAIIPLGSKLYIPMLTAITSQKHNGIVFAHDIGSLINGHSIDIFVGYKENTKLLTDAGIHSSNLVDVYLLD